MGSLLTSYTERNDLKVVAPLLHKSNDLFRFESRLSLAAHSLPTVAHSLSIEYHNQLSLLVQEMNASCVLGSKKAKQSEALENLQSYRKLRSGFGRTWSIRQQRKNASSSICKSSYL